MSFDEYICVLQGVLHTFFRVQDGPRCQNLRETPHLGNAQATAACDYPLDPCTCVKVGNGAKASKGDSCASWKSLRIPWPAAGRLHCVSRRREVEQVSNAKNTSAGHDGRRLRRPGRPCDVCCAVDLQSHLVRQKRSGAAAGPRCPELAVAE